MTLADNGIRLHIGLLVLLSLLPLESCWKERSDEIAVFRGLAMGTAYSIKLAFLPPSLDRKNLRLEIQKTLDEINRLMSTHLFSSEISRFNSYRKTDWFALSPLTMRVVEEALFVSRQSNGAFDLTVGNLVEAWGFGKESPRERIPNSDAIDALLQDVGYEKISVNRERTAIKKGSPKVTVDLSAIAKGFAVDEVARLLERHRIVHYLVEVGGEIRTRGVKRKGHPWIIAIEKPVVGERRIYKTLHIGQNGMATSGDYRNFFVHGGKRYPHVIDPKTGYPIAHDTRSVTVAHSSCAKADAWATALLVLGREQGYKAAIRNNLAALFVYQTSEGFEEVGTPGFSHYTDR